MSLAAGPTASRRVAIVAAVIGIVVALVLSGAALALSEAASTANSAGAQCSSTAPKLTVQGTGSASQTPNVLTVSVGIDVTDSTAEASLSDNNSKAAAVTAALTRGGIAGKNLQTSDFSIQPVYNVQGVPTGYEVTNTLTAQVRNLANAGSVIDALADAAGNAVRINSLSFSVSDPRVMEDDAREQAVHQAVSHAQAMARAAGERLGTVCSLTDATPVQPEPVPYGPLGTPTRTAGPVPLQPGNQEAPANVTMIYALETTTASS
jgi:uncharacterized protein